MENDPKHLREEVWRCQLLYLAYTEHGPTILPPQLEFLNIYRRLKSQLFTKSCLFKGQRVQ